MNSFINYLLSTASEYWVKLSITCGTSALPWQYSQPTSAWIIQMWLPLTYIRFQKKSNKELLKHLLAQYNGKQGLSYVNHPGKPIPETKVSLV